MSGFYTNKDLHEAIDLLKRLISTPSFSDEEAQVASIWEEWLTNQNVLSHRFLNNVYALSSNWDENKPVFLLNSHIDTVKPVSSYTRNPFEPSLENDRLYGLGSNDAGASGVALAQSFLKLKDREDLPFNLLLALTASEEKMGENGMRAFLLHLKELNLYPSLAIVGEPTGMQPAVAERGLVVIDAEVKGIAGHAARNEGVNAIYRAIEDIETIRKFEAPKVSPVLGPIKATVTVIEGGSLHNVVPDKCRYVVDVRTTDAYSNEETLELLQNVLKWSQLSPRSFRIRASVIDSRHPLVSAAMNLGRTPFVSPTTSDMALMNDFPSLKIGPGKSERSHSADEFVLVSEIRQALELYPELILGVANS